MYFDINTITVETWALFGASILALTYIIVAYLGRLRNVCHIESARPATDAAVSASVIVYADEDAEQLDQLLRAILAQKHVPQFDVIVVNEGSSEEVRQIVGLLKVEFPNIYLTFTPDGARNLSRKKLGLTIGVKAAQGDVVVITDSRFIPQSELWLASMLQPFARPDVSVALGAARTNWQNDERGFFRVRAFDWAATTATWLSSALRGAPYRGCAGNLAYRRELFFKNKGFSRSLNLRYGDDDIFVNEITTPSNTAVVLSADSIVTRRMWNHRREQKREKCSHEFTGRHLPHASRRIMAAGEWLMWLMPALSAAIILTTPMCNIAGWIMAAAPLLAMWIVTAWRWRRTLLKLHMRPLRLTLPWIAMTRPLRNALTAIKCRITKGNNYTWN